MILTDLLSVLIILAASVQSIDYDKLDVDDFTGELLKPDGWSEAKFHAVKQMRMRVSILLENFILLYIYCS